MSNLGPQPDKPPACDWCKFSIQSDDWVECDEWYLCGACYRALMDGTAGEFSARKGVV